MLYNYVTASLLPDPRYTTTSTSTSTTQTVTTSTAITDITTIAPNVIADTTNIDDTPEVCDADKWNTDDIIDVCESQLYLSF